MAALSVVLAIVAIAAVILAIGALMRAERQPRPPPDDRAAPYREGLHAAVRLQRSAQDLEQQIWAAAARHADAEGSVASEERRP